MPANPFLEDKGQALALALMSIGGGISQAANSGQGGWAGVGPGAMNFVSAMGQARQQKEMEDLRRWQIGLQERQIKNAEDERKSQREVGMRMAASLEPPGMRPATPLPSLGPGADALTRSREAIAGNESAGQPNGGYGAVGPVANPKGNRAYGRYQVMDFNVGPWTQEALGRTMTPQEFLASPEAQDAVFNHKFGQYRQQYGSDEAAARAWFAGPGGMNNPSAKDVLGTTVSGYADRFKQGYGASPATPTIAQGDNPGITPVQAQTRDMLPSLTPEVLQSHDFRSTIPADIKQQASQLFMAGKVNEGNALIAPYRKPPDLSQEVVYINGKPYRNTLGKKSDNWRPLTADDVRVKLGPNANPSVSYQENTITGEIKPIGQAPVAVNINSEQQTEFAKEVGKNDAKRLVEIQNAEHQMSDFASKIRFATEQLGETYTGTGAEGANAWFKALGSLGFEDAGKKANAAAAAQAIISQMKPHMRASGSGASSDKDMDMFAQALPSLVNLPGGNQRIAGYFDKLSERATEIRRLAEEHSAGGTKALSGTQFADAVKKLGPLFTDAERKELQDAAKNKPAAATKERPPLSTIFQGGAPNMSPRPDLNTILGRP